MIRKSLLNLPLRGLLPWLIATQASLATMQINKNNRYRTPSSLQESLIKEMEKYNVGGFQSYLALIQESEINTPIKGRLLPFFYLSVRAMYSKNPGFFTTKLLEKGANFMLFDCKGIPLWHKFVHEKPVLFETIWKYSKYTIDVCQKVSNTGNTILHDGPKQGMEYSDYATILKKDPKGFMQAKNKEGKYLLHCIDGDYHYLSSVIKNWDPRWDNKLWNAKDDKGNTWLHTFIDYILEEGFLEDHQIKEELEHLIDLFQNGLLDLHQKNRKGETIIERLYQAYHVRSAVYLLDKVTSGIGPSSKYGKQNNMNLSQRLETINQENKHYSFDKGLMKVKEAAYKMVLNRKKVAECLTTPPKNSLFYTLGVPGGIILYIIGYLV